MSESLDSGLAATANTPSADTHTTPDAALDAVFDAPEAPAASEPSATPEPVNEPAAATVQPQTPADPNGAKGEPPRERWDSILENARRKEREATLAAHKDHLEIVKRLQDDLPGTLAQLLEEGSNDPRFSEQLTSRAAAILAARNKQAKADSEPEPDLQTGDGALVYSADQLRKWHQWNSSKTEKQMLERFQPLQQLQQRFEQHQQAQKLASEAASVAERRGAQWKAMPFFADHQPAIVARQAEIYAELQGQPGFDPMGSPWEALQQAYREVVSTQAVPKLQLQQTDSLVAQAARKRAGSSSDPAASAPAQPRRPRTPDEAVDSVFAPYVGV